MNKRQRLLNVTSYGYERGVKNNEFMADFEAFEAKASTLKKGEYQLLDILKDWFKDSFLGDLSAENNHADAKRFCYGLTVKHPKQFTYTDTNGLDSLTVK